MSPFDPTEAEVRPGARLRYSDGATEIIVSERGGRTGEFALTYVDAEIARPGASGAFALQALTVSKLSLTSTRADRADLPARYKRARAYFLELTTACAELTTLRVTITKGQDESDVTAVVCPPLLAPAILIYGPRQRDAAMLTAIE